MHACSAFFWSLKSGEKAIFCKKKKTTKKLSGTRYWKKIDLSMITVKSDVTHMINWI